MQGPRGVPLPWRQRDLADALGLSLVHTNKTLARLRILGAAHWSGGYLAVPDPARLAELAQEEDGASTPRPLF
jgi:CRP-like cAMP-binding protein